MLQLAESGNMETSPAPENHYECQEEQKDAPALEFLESHLDHHDDDSKDDGQDHVAHQLAVGVLPGFLSLEPGLQV